MELRNLATSQLRNAVTRRDFGRGLAAILAAGVAPSPCGATTGGLRRGLAARLSGMGGEDGERPLWVMPTKVDTDHTPYYTTSICDLKVGTVYQDGTNNGYILGPKVRNFQLNADSFSFDTNGGNLWYGPCVPQILPKNKNYRFSCDRDRTSIRIGIVGYVKSGTGFQFSSTISNSASNVQTFNTGEYDLILFSFLGTTINNERITYSNFKIEEIV